MWIPTLGEKWPHSREHVGLGGGNSHIFDFPPRIPGQMIQFDHSNIFQMGWFNHQLLPT